MRFPLPLLLPILTLALLLPLSSTQSTPQPSPAASRPPRKPTCTYYSSYFKRLRAHVQLPISEPECANIEKAAEAFVDLYGLPSGSPILDLRYNEREGECVFWLSTRSLEDPGGLADCVVPGIREVLRNCVC